MLHSHQKTCISFVFVLLFQMENVHLVPEEEEDDLYTGYNEYNPTFDSEVHKYLHLRHAFIECHNLLLCIMIFLSLQDLHNDVGFQQAVRTSHGRRPPVSYTVSAD